MKILVTGGAGFIGTHVSRHLLREGCTVTVLDCFCQQVHGSNRDLACDLRGDVRLVRADVRDANALSKALAGQDVVVHLAAETGTGQSMYRVKQYEDVNVGGTALLFDCLVNDRRSKVEKVVTASSRAVYGEGKYDCRSHGTVYPKPRRVEDMKAGSFETLCPLCRQPCESVATDEDSRIAPVSFYGLTKQAQEQMTLLFAETLGISGFALRYQNVYGPGQSLSNPYTGILAIFSNQARTGRPIEIFEDGQESRDFVFIDDAVDATWRCLLKEAKGNEVLNVGSGERTSVLDVVDEIVAFFDSRSDVSISGAFRQGDIRHNLADVRKIRNLLGFEPKWKFRDGIREFLRWVREQEPVACAYGESLNEMRERGLMHG